MADNLKPEMKNLAKKKKNFYSHPNHLQKYFLSPNEYRGWWKQQVRARAERSFCEWSTWRWSRSLRGVVTCSPRWPTAQRCNPPGARSYRSSSCRNVKHTWRSHASTSSYTGYHNVDRILVPFFRRDYFGSVLLRRISVARQNLEPAVARKHTQINKYLKKYEREKQTHHGLNLCFLHHHVKNDAFKK